MRALAAKRAVRVWLTRDRKSSQKVCFFSIYTSRTLSLLVFLKETGRNSTGFSKTVMHSHIWQTLNESPWLVFFPTFAITEMAHSLRSLWSPLNYSRAFNNTHWNRELPATTTQHAILFQRNHGERKKENKKREGYEADLNDVMFSKIFKHLLAHTQDHPVLARLAFSAMTVSYVFQRH